MGAKPEDQSAPAPPPSPVNSAALYRNQLQQLRHRIQSYTYDAAHDHPVDPDVLQIAANFQLGLRGHVVSIPPAHDLLDEQRDLVPIAHREGLPRQLDPAVELALQRQAFAERGAQSEAHLGELGVENGALFGKIAQNFLASETPQAAVVVLLREVRKQLLLDRFGLRAMAFALAQVGEKLRQRRVELHAQLMLGIVRHLLQQIRHPGDQPVDDVAVDELRGVARYLAELGREHLAVRAYPALHHTQPGVEELLVLTFRGEQLEHARGETRGVYPLELRRERLIEQVSHVFVFEC